MAEPILSLTEIEEIKMPTYIVQQLPVRQIVVKWWNSIDEIMLRYPNFKKHIIERNLKGITKSGHGFIWFYYTPPEEIYKTLTYYPDFDISNYGNVRNNKTSEQVIKTINNDGYEIVEIHNNDSNMLSSKLYPSKNEIICVHLLVAHTFLTNFSYTYLDNKTIVYHKDGNILNNIIDNLTFDRPEHLPVKINQIDMTNNKIIKTFNSIEDVNIPNANIDHILNACKGICNCSNGYAWSFNYD